MKKVNLCKFDCTKEELEEKGVLFIPHKGYDDLSTERERERVWREHLKKNEPRPTT